MCKNTKKKKKVALTAFMEQEKGYNGVNREAWWQVLGIYRKRGNRFGRYFVHRKVMRYLRVSNGLRQGCGVYNVHVRVFHLPQLTPILLFKILKLCLTIKLMEMKKI